MATPSQRLSSFVQRVTQCMSANTFARGSAWNSGQLNIFTRSTSGTGKTARSHVAGSNCGTSPACSTGHLRVSACRGGRRSARFVSGLMIASSLTQTSEPIRRFRRLEDR